MLIKNKLFYMVLASSVYLVTYGYEQNQPSLHDQLLKVQQEIVNLENSKKELESKISLAAKKQQEEFARCKYEQQQLEKALEIAKVNKNQAANHYADQVKRWNYLQSAYGTDLAYYDQLVAKYQQQVDENKRLEAELEQLGYSIRKLSKQILVLTQQEHQIKHEAQQEHNELQRFQNLTSYEREVYANQWLQNRIISLKNEHERLENERQRLAYDLLKWQEHNDELRLKIHAQLEKKESFDQQLQAKDVSTKVYPKPSTPAQELLNIMISWINMGTHNKQLLRDKLDALYASYSCSSLQLLQEAREVSALYESSVLEELLSQEVGEQQKGFFTKHPIWATTLCTAGISLIMCFVS